MGISFVIGTVTYDVNGLPGVDGAQAATFGRYARQFDPGDRVADLRKRRVSGANGSLVMRNGYVGHNIQVAVRYVANTKDLLESTIATDLAEFDSGAVTITYQGQTYNGCNLVPGSAKRTAPILATGRVDGQVYVDMTMLFTEDLPTIA